VDDLVAAGLVMRKPGLGMMVTNEVPSENGRSAESPSTRTIALIVANTLGSFVSMVVQGVDEVLREAGYRMTVSVSDDRFDLERAAIRSAMEHHVDGMLLYSVNPRNGVNPNCLDYLRVHEQGVPLLLLDHYFPDLSLGYVVGDNRGNMRTLTEGLFARGYERLGLIHGDLAVTSVRDRYQGFADGVMAHRQRAAAVIEAGGRHTGLDDVRLGELAVARHLEREGALPDALLASSSYLAIGAQRALRAAGVDVPEQVAVIGYEDVPEAALLDVPLTVMDVPVASLGREAAGRMVDLIESGGDAADIRIELPAKLIVRASCGTDPKSWESQALVPV